MARFLFVDPNLEYVARDEPRSVGGASVQAFNWLRGLLANGEEVACLVTASSPLSIPSGVISFTSYEPAGGWGYVTKQVPFLNRVLQRYRPDFVYPGAAGVITGLMAALAPRHGARFLHRLANDADLDARRAGRLGRGKRLIYDFGLRQADAVLCQNDYQLSMLRGIRKGKPSQVFGNPIWLYASRSAPDVGRNYAAWLGLFQAQKNVEALVHIAAALPKVRFEIAGRAAAGADAATLAAVAELERLPNVRLAGYLTRAEVPAFLAGARVLVSTSHFEGFPNTYLEAWAVGTPVAALRSADPDGRIDRFGLGTVADTVEELAAGIASLALGSSASLREVCTRYVREHHDAVTVSRRLLEWLHEAFPEANGE